MKQILLIFFLLGICLTAVAQDADSAYSSVPFHRRYFFTTNALPLKKGERYVIMSLYGPEVRYALRNNFSVGMLSSWVAVPVIISAKYSVRLANGLHASVGGMAGSLTWLNPSAFATLGFGNITIGSLRYNVNASVGYLYLSNQAGAQRAPLYMLGTLISLNSKVAVVGEAFIYNYPGSSFSIIIPGLRFGVPYKNAFQFGLTTMFFEGNPNPLPFPVVSWIKAF